MGTTEANFKKAKVTQVPMKCSIDVAYSHFSEVPVPMRDVRSWGKTGSGQRWGKPTRLTRSRSSSFSSRSGPLFHWAPWERSTVGEVMSVGQVLHIGEMPCVSPLECLPR
jgi:hypothetical protein